MTTASTVEAALEELKINYSDVWNWVFYEAHGEYKTVGGLTIEIETSFGGEGMGDQAYIVLKTRDTAANVQYFRKDGYYASYDGFTWDGDFYEVTPKQKTITVYEDRTPASAFDSAEGNYDSFDSFGEFN